MNQGRMIDSCILSTMKKHIPKVKMTVKGMIAASIVTNTATIVGAELL